MPEADLYAAPIRFTSDPAELSEATVFIVTVPTPIDDAKQPDLARCAQPPPRWAQL